MTAPTRGLAAQGPAERPERWPLTEAQLGIWFAQRIDPDSPAYQTGQYVVLDGALDRAAFAAAVRTAVDEADVLALRFLEEDGAPAMVRDEDAQPMLEVVDVSGTGDPFAAAMASMAADMARPGDPLRGGLAAERLYVLRNERHLWYQRLHHIVADGYGTALLTARIADLYSALASGEPPRTAAFGPLLGVLREDADYQTSTRRAVDRDYWAKALDGLPEIVGLASGPALAARTHHRCAMDLPASFAARLQGLAAEAKAPWPDVLVALVGAYVGRFVGGQEAVVGVPHMARFGSAAASVPAMVMNILPLRVGLDEDSSVAAHVASVAAGLRAARRHGRFRGEHIRRELGRLGGERRLHGPLVNVLPFFERQPRMAGLATRLERLGSGAVDDITFTILASPSGQDCRIEVDANPTLYGREETKAHAERLAVFLERAVAAATLGSVPTLTEAEERAEIVAVNDTAHKVPETTLWALIGGQIEATPDAAAMRFERETLTYRALGEAVDATARRLAAEGVGRGDIVAVALPRSIGMVVTMLAALRLGAAYLPIDLGHPPARIAAMLRLAQPRAIASDERHRHLFPAGSRLVSARANGTVPPPARALPAAEPTGAAYVIFTSGSTGEPKGVVVEHRAIVNRLLWMREQYAIGPGDRILQKTPASFDVSVWELFLPLLAGATLVVAPPEVHKDPAALAALIGSERISAVHFVPSMLAQFLAEPLAAGLAIARVFCSGEELPAWLRDRFHEIVRGELHNLYGPTEAAVDVSYWPASAGDDSRPVPIGFPVWNTRLYVLDGRLRPVPRGVAGQLHIAGAQLARGYIGRPDLTAERFVPDPFGAPGERMYATGDLARRRTDGAIEFLGRADGQVKIRGVRIEIGEVEAALTGLGGIAEAAVLLRKDAAGEGRLVAYVVPAKGGAPVTAEALRAQLAATLPEAMIPAAIVILDGLPVTGNGKLDRAALPEPAGPVSAGRAPASATEKTVAALFAATLGLDPATVHAEDDFFLLGGHSLKAADLMRRVRAAFAVEIELGAVFAHPTVGRFASHVDALRAGETRRADLAVLLPLTTAEAGAPVACIHPAGGLGWCYAGLARALGDRPVYALQARGLTAGEAPAASLEAMARDYVETLAAVSAGRTVHLVGWSVGGIVAQAMAAEMAARGMPVGAVALLDAYPSEVWRDEPPPDERAALEALLRIAGHEIGEIAGELTREAAIRFLRAGGHALGQLPEETIGAIARIVENNARLVRQYSHRRYAGRLVHFRAAAEHGDGLDASLWAPHVAAVEAHDLPYRHGQMLSPAALATIVPRLQAAFAEADGSR
ncbi:MAG: amino acid adenylation domain-containing protein [Bauldia sp.]|nr:amino acid adenylation domain-containing protein [Bauldia sp.]